ncbi:hypothetical protein SY88_15925 [Clostridiales bacterium PH28_bin88]|nr:hypothetical protein SY88_15925 [Clostridiales bacterium PH28_bin88]
MKVKKTTERDIVQAVDKCIDILFSFSPEQPELGITELSERLGLYKSTVYRLLKTLEYRGLVTKNEQNQKYRLGLRLFDLGNIVISQIELRSVALPLMRELSAKTRESVTLNIASNGERVCIEKVESVEDIRNFVQIGLHNPLYVGASGKVLLAYLPEEELEGVLGNLGDKDASGRPMERDKLLQDLEEIRRRGYAFTHGERNKESASISAPIFDHTGRLAAGIGVSGPYTRFTFERATLICQLTLDTAREISYRMGWKPLQSTVNIGK